MFVSTGGQLEGDILITGLGMWLTLNGVYVLLLYPLNQEFVLMGTINARNV